MRVSNKTLANFDQVKRNRDLPGFVLEPMSEKPECSCIFCDAPVSRSMQRLFDPPLHHFESLKEQQPDFRGRAAWVCTRHYGAARYTTQTSGVVPTFEQLYDMFSKKAAGKSTWSDLPGFKFVADAGQEPVLWYIGTKGDEPLKVDTSLYSKFRDFVTSCTIRVVHQGARQAMFDEWAAKNPCDHRSLIAFELFLQL